MIELAATTARDVGVLAIGDDLVVNRFGFGAMRITGSGVWGPRPDHFGGDRQLPSGDRSRRQLDRHR